MGIFTDQTKDYSTEELVDVLGRRWGVFNKPSTGMFIVRGCKVDGNIVEIDNRYQVPTECEGDWTKKEWAQDAIKRYIKRLNLETEAQTKRAESKERNKAREEMNASSTG